MRIKKYLVMGLMILVVLSLNKSVGAYQGNVSGYLTPATRTVMVGEVFNSKIFVNSGTNKISVVNLKLNVDSSKLKVKSVVANSGVFGNVFLQEVSGNIVNIYIASLKNSAELPSGQIEVGTVVFEGVANGNVEVGLVEGWEVTGPSTTGDYSYNLNWQKGVYTVGSAITGQDLVLNYKVALANVNANGAKCLNTPSLKISVVGNGQSKTYEGVMPQSREIVGNKLVFGGSLNLTGFNESGGVAVFVSGPKQLQMKYGKNNQTAVYGKAGGELALTKSIDRVYDFSAYPMLGGDVVANDSQDGQDGVINGVDFAYIKSRSLIHETVNEGGYLQGDLDGNCQVNSNDVNILKMSLREKQGELY